MDGPVIVVPTLLIFLGMGEVLGFDEFLEGKRGLLLLNLKKWIYSFGNQVFIIIHHLASILKRDSGEFANSDRPLPSTRMEVKAAGRKCKATPLSLLYSKLDIR